MALRQGFIIVRPGAGDHRDLPGSLHPRRRPGGEGGPAAAQDHHVLSLERNPRPAEHIQKAVDVRVIARQLPVPADQGVYASNGLRRRVDRAAESHHVPLVGNRDVQPADILPAEKIPQLLGLQLKEAVALAAQGLVDGNGPAVAQAAAQKAVTLFAHTSA